MLITEIEIYLDKPEKKNLTEIHLLERRMLSKRNAYSSALRWNRADMFEEQQGGQRARAEKPEGRRLTYIKFYLSNSSFPLSDVQQ